MNIKAWPIATPSWVFPGPAADAVNKLVDYAGEIDLCCYFHEKCALWTEVDLPPSLATLPLRWHLHLPVDLPWAQGGAAAAKAAFAVWQKCAYLKPWGGVLHIPQGDAAKASALLRDFVKAWRDLGQPSRFLHLENLKDAPLSPQEKVILEMDTSVCVDVSHTMAWGHEDVLEHPEILKRSSLAHWSSPGKADEHLPLHTWTNAQSDFALKAMEALPATTTHVLEVFQWEGYCSSVPILQDLLRKFGRQPD